jgi:hypothetical protein
MYYDELVFPRDLQYRPVQIALALEKCNLFYCALAFPCDLWNYLYQRVSFARIIRYKIHGRNNNIVAETTLYHLVHIVLAQEM